MEHAIRVLREELHWLRLAYRRAVADLTNPLVPPGLGLALAGKLAEEIDEVTEALDCLTCVAEMDFQPPLPFMDGLAAQPALVAAE